MKSILQKAAIVIAVLAVVIGIGAYFLTHDPDKKANSELSAIPTVVDAEGTTYGVVVNEQGTTYVVVTDEETNRYMAEFDGVTVGSTVTQINDEVKAEDLPVNYTGPDVSVSQNISDYMGEVVTGQTDKNVPSTTAPAAENNGTDNDGADVTVPAEENNPTAGDPGTADVDSTTAQAADKTTKPGQKPGATTQAADKTTTPGQKPGATTQVADKTTTPGQKPGATTQAADKTTKPGQKPGSTTQAANNNTTKPGQKPGSTTQASDKTTKPAGNQSVTTTTSNGAPAQTTAPSSSTSPNQAYRIKKYEEIFKSGTYVMTVTMNDPEYPEPVTMALKNGNIFIETAMAMEEGAEPFKMKMLYIKNTDTMYLLIDDFKKYCKLPEEMVADFDMSSMVSDFKITTVGEIKVSQANINGKNLVVESYVNEAGETVNYYFDGENLVRLDTISKKGTVDSVYYSMFSTDVSDTYFQISDDYGYWNLSWIGALM